MAVIILFLIYVLLMLPASETVIWICIFIIFYTYAGYPLLLIVLVFFKNLLKTAEVKYNNISIPVTLVVAAYNEEDILEEKIKNCLSLEYPEEKMSIIFITDGSTDNTGKVLEKYPRIIHLHEDVRKGKLAAMNRAMQFVETGIVIFSDANTVLNKESISKIMTHYSDVKVGGVSGEKKILTGENGAVAGGEGLYWKYESYIKNLDSQLYTIAGAAGELFSIRSALYSQLPEDIIIEDFVQSLMLCTKGYVVRYEKDAFSIEKASFSVKDEMERKIRIAAGGFQAMLFLIKILNVFRYPVLSFQYISHRVLRWTLCPLALLLLFIGSFAAWIGHRSPLYGYFTLLQALFYLMALGGWMMARKNRHPAVFYFPYYFVFMNFCVFAGFARFLMGNQQVTWRKASRK